MYKYRHTKTGRIVTTTCPVKGDQWEELTEEQELPAGGGNELTEDQAPAKPAKPANPAKKGKK